MVKFLLQIKTDVEYSKHELPTGYCEHTFESKFFATHTFIK